MKAIVILFCLFFILSCSQSLKMKDKQPLIDLIKDQELANDIDTFLIKNTISDSMDRASGFSVSERYYYLFKENICNGHQILEVIKLPFIRSEVFDSNNYLGHYIYKKNFLIFEKLSDSLLINTLILNKGILADIPDENSIEGLTMMGDHVFIAYVRKEDGTYQLVCQNPIDYLEPLSNDTAYFECF